MTREFKLGKCPERTTNAFNHGKHWTQEHTLWLAEGFKKGYGAIQLANNLGRTQVSIACKLKALGLIAEDDYGAYWYKVQQDLKVADGKVMNYSDTQKQHPSPELDAISKEWVAAPDFPGTVQVFGTNLQGDEMVNIGGKDYVLQRPRRGGKTEAFLEGLANAATTKWATVNSKTGEVKPLTDSEVRPVKVTKERKYILTGDYSGLEARVVAQALDKISAQDDRDDTLVYAFNALRKEYGLTKEKEMTKTIETKTFIQGTDAAGMSDEHIFALIAKLEGRVVELEAIKNKPKKLVAQIKSINDDIAALVAYVDKR